MKYAGYYFVLIYHILCSQNNNIKLDNIKLDDTWKNAYVCKYM